MQEKQFLNSWKEVAAYVGRSQRTLQRWEKHLKLPVHRPAGRMRSAVIALTTEIDEWIRRTPVAKTITMPEPAKAKTAIPRRAVKTLPVLLCIDEDVTSGNVRKEFLEANGYRVLTASDGRIGVEMFESNSIALVVLSCCEESLDTEVVARMLKRRKPKVPIVMMMGVKELPAGTLQLADRVVEHALGADALLSIIRGWPDMANARENRI